MKKEYPILLGLFFSLLLFVPNSSFSRACSSDFFYQKIEGLATPPSAPVALILQKASGPLGMKFRDLFRAYRNGKVSIEQIGPGKYLVDAGGGNVAVVVLDSL